MFWRIGFTSAWRNLARSVLALVSMALAAGFMTNAFALSRGHANQHYQGLRSLVGGEISAYSLSLNASVSESDSSWHYQEFIGLEDTDLALMMPELTATGYFTAINSQQEFSPEDIAGMASNASIRAVYPRYQIPAYSSGHAGMWSTPIRGMDAGLDQLQYSHLSEYISEGRWLSDEDEGKMVAVINAQQSYPLGHRAPGIDEMLRVVVPRIRTVGKTTTYDYRNPLLLELRVIGILDIPTRLASYDDMSGNAPESFFLQLYARNNEISVPLETWQQIWSLAGGETYSPRQLAILVDDLSYLEDIVLTLQQQFPLYAFYSLPMLFERAAPSFILENPYKAHLEPRFAVQFTVPPPDSQAVIALDMRLPLSVLIFVNAALVIASNLLIMVSERRQEIGILKAVGSTRIQVVQMVLSEALLISVFGSSIGFFFFRMPAVFNQLTNGVAFISLVGDVLIDMFVVLGTATSAALLFGMLPALTMANLSVREVLQ